MESKIFLKLRPYLGVIFLQFGSAGFGIVAKAALNQGSSNYTFAVYRNAIAAALFIPFALIFERKTRPKMTFSVFWKILLLSLFDPVIGQNMFYAGMRYSSATFAAALCNLIPAITFVLAWILRIEKVNFKSLRSYAKIMGTLVTVGGAMLMTLIAGPVIGLPWTHESHDNQQTSSPEDPVRGAIMIAVGCTGYSAFYTLQAITLKSYPAGLSLTAMVCSLGAFLGTILTFVAQRGNTSIWAFGWDAKLLAYVYGGVVCSGITYYLSGVIMKEKGPVFVTAFNPLGMVIVAVMSSFIFAEQMTVGKICGATVIVIGLYLPTSQEVDSRALREITKRVEKSWERVGANRMSGLEIKAPRCSIASVPIQSVPISATTLTNPLTKKVEEITILREPSLRVMRKTLWCLVQPMIIHPICKTANSISPKTVDDVLERRLVYLSRRRRQSELKTRQSWSQIEKDPTR
ncbi:WAT1-related protein [Striga hermonthica]|uniref:WAT1-related protein n=1 Tax=Striga hermonthica TaxID=68872 RepID=A0A9N7N1Y8_STRHE|nr:WAT1-related protein [Striga hermonthica]